MWSGRDIGLTIEEAEHPTVIVRVDTPVGQVKLIAEIEMRGRVLWITSAHIQGLRPGALGRSGLNAIARKLLEETDAEGLVVQGSSRTTGTGRGRAPKPFRFPR